MVDGSASVGSDTNRVPKPTSIVDVPQQEVNEDLAQRYEAYKEAGKIKPAQQQEIEAKLAAQAKGDFGFWETAAAITEGFLTTGVGTPVFQYDNKEDLEAKRIQKNKNDFLSDLSEEELIELKTFAGKQVDSIESANLNALAENKMLKERSKALVNELASAATAIQQMQENGEEVPEQAIEHYEERRQELKGLESVYNSNIDFIENNNEDIIDFYSEIDLLKRNYGGLDYYADMSRLASASLLVGAQQMAISTDTFTQDKLGVNLLTLTDDEDKKEISERLQKERDEIAAQQELQKPNISVGEIESMEDFFGWSFEQAVTQLPVLTVLAVSGGTAGLGVLGASAGGQKIGELQTERIEANKTIEQMENLLATREDFTEEEVIAIEKEIEASERSANITDDEMFFSGVGAMTFEILTEKVTLGILSKGKRAYMAAKKSGLKDFGKSLGRSLGAVGSGLSEGGAEFANQFGGNLVDIMYLNDSSVHMFDGTIDALASGTAMGFGMKIAPIGLGMGAKAIMRKSETSQVKLDTTKIAELEGELQENGDTLDPQTVKEVEAKIKTLKKNVADTMKKSFDDVTGMNKDDIAELIELDKKANSITQRVQGLQKSNINKEMKAELIKDLKDDIDKIATRKQELLDKKNTGSVSTAEMESGSTVNSKEKYNAINDEIDSLQEKIDNDTATEAESTRYRELLSQANDVLAQEIEVSSMIEAEIDALESNKNISNRVKKRRLKELNKQLIEGHTNGFELTTKETRKTESTGLEGDNFTEPTGSEVQGEVREDTDTSSNVARTKIKLKRKGKGLHMDTVNGYTVRKNKNGKWEIVTKADNKGKFGETILAEVKTLKEAAAYLQEQTSKREALLEESSVTSGQGSLFQTTDKGSKFNWRKLLAGVPVITYVDERVFGRMSKAIEDKLSYYGNKAFLGQMDIALDKSTDKAGVREVGRVLKNLGISSANAIVKQSAILANGLYKGALRTDEEIASSRKLEGFQERSLMSARNLSKQLSNIIEGDQDMAKRVHQALDPELYDETVKYEDLNAQEKTLFDSLRAINQQTHETNFKNGFISKETFDKYDGKYIGRGYEVHEGLTEDVEKEVFIDSKIWGKIYDKRKEVNQWIIDNTVNDPIFLTMTRMARTQRNVVVKEYANFVSQKYGVAEKPESGAFTQLTGKSYGELNGKWIPTNVAEDFKGYFFNNKILDGLHLAADNYNKTKYKQFMKRFHTVYSPLVQVGNLVSNHAFAFASGVNIVQLYKNIPSAVANLKNKDGDYELALQEGIIGSNVLEKDLKLKDERTLKLNNKKSTRLGKLDKFARRAYAASDNAMKLAAYKSMKEVGYNHEEATQRVYEGFQNYASVGKIWDLASKTPVWGSDYVKFQGDLNRIVKNSVTKRPLTTMTFLMGLSGVASLLSAASGEEEGERAIREGRKFIPKIKTFVGDFPLVFKVANKEVNLARYISPYYSYDKGNEHWSEKLMSYSPINYSYDEETGTRRIVPSDVATGSIWAAFMDNKDFRGKIISDPTYNIYSGSTATDSEKLWNRVVYVLRSQIPLFSFGHDAALSAVYEQDYYGRDKSPVDILMSRIVKIQTWDGDTTKEQILKDLGSIEYQEKKLKTKRSALNNGYDKEVLELEAKLSRGDISKEAYESTLSLISTDFEKRSVVLAGKEAELQQEFNNLEENVRNSGISFKSILEYESP